MEIGSQRVAALMLMAGSVIFLAAAFSPISRVFGPGSPERKLEIIMAAPTQWTVAQIMFGLGALVTVVGLGIMAHHLRALATPLLTYGTTAVLLAGSLLWVWHLYLRTIDPAAFAEGLVPLWLFAGYSLLTMAGLAAFGWVFLQTPLQSWVGWMMIGSMAFFFVMAVIFADMPPFVYYLITLAAGVAIFRAGPLV